MLYLEDGARHPIELSRYRRVRRPLTPRQMLQVGRAKLIELVDAASAALGKKSEFAPAAARLCQFVSNA